jgi:hypothetical protein
MYKTEDGLTKIEVELRGETVWLSLDQMAELFQRDKSAVSQHIKIFLQRANSIEAQLLQILQQLPLTGKPIRLITTTLMLLFLSVTVLNPCEAPSSAFGQVLFLRSTFKKVLL